MQTLIVFFILGISIPNPFKLVRELQAHKVLYREERINDQYRSPWNWTFVGPEGGEVLWAVSHPNSNGSALAITIGDVWRTTDGGANWELVLPDIWPQAGMMSTPATGIVVDGGEQVLITLDAGQNWTPVHNCYDFQTGTFDVIDTVIYFVDSFPLRVWQSTNSGLTWQLRGTIDSLDYADAIAHIPGAPSWIRLVGHNSSNDSIAYILNSQDYGATWTFIDTIIASDINDFQQDPWDIWHTMICTDRGIYQATSGTGPWSLMAEPFIYGLYQPVDLEFIGNDTVLVSSVLNPGIFIGVNNFGIWFFNQVENREVCGKMSPGGVNTFYCGSLGQGVFKSTDKGQTWSIQKNNLYAQTLISRGAASQVPDSTLYFVEFGGNVYQTSDWGANWAELQDFLFYGSAIETAPTDPNFIIVSALNIAVVGTTLTHYTIYTSTDAGVNWNPVDSTYNVSDFAICSDPNIIVGLVDTFLIRSDSGGRYFTPVFENVNSFVELTGIDTLFVATDETTYVSYDQGATWSPLLGYGGEISYDNTRKLLYIAGDNLYRYDLNSGILDSLQYYSISVSVSPNGNLYFLGLTDTLRIARSFDGGNTVEDEIFPIVFSLGGLVAADGGLFCYRAFRGFWVSNDITSGIMDYPEDLPNAQTLFVPTLIRRGATPKICLEIDKELELKIKLYDISGRKIKEIFEGRVRPGRHILEYSTQDLSCGIYFLFLHCAQGDQVRKQVIF